MGGVGFAKSFSCQNQRLCCVEVRVRVGSLTIKKRESWTQFLFNKFMDNSKGCTKKTSFCPNPLKTIRSNSTSVGPSKCCLSFL